MYLLALHEKGFILSQVYEILTNKEYMDKDEYSQSVFYGEEI